MGCAEPAGAVKGAVSLTLSLCSLRLLCVLCGKSWFPLRLFGESLIFASCLSRHYRPGARINFCTRQFNNSATYSSFSDGHAIS